MVSNRFYGFQIHFKLLQWQFSLSDMVRRLEEELDSSNGESRNFSAELVRNTARYERAQEHNTKTMAEVATLTGDLEEANLTIHGHALRNIYLMSWFDALRHQVDVMAIDKEFLHVSTQTDPLPSVVTSPSLVAGRKSPSPVDDAPDLPPDSPNDEPVPCDKRGCVKLNDRDLSEYLNEVDYLAKRAERIRREEAAAIHYFFRYKSILSTVKFYINTLRVLIIKNVAFFLSFLL